MLKETYLIASAHPATSQVNIEAHLLIRSPSGIRTSIYTHGSIHIRTQVPAVYSLVASVRRVQDVGHRRIEMELHTERISAGHHRQSGSKPASHQRAVRRRQTLRDAPREIR